ncbi:hypothetical protein [Paenibacillus antri]|uniref:hypothetical protein n=1 Tax=Paenibacillus antri TaxID=2582848 RepID=UPI00192E6F8D|nr:hypothetical protein [Paenibacillus antri]
MILWEQFDRNEWYVIGMTVAAYAAVFLLPRKVPVSYMILGLVWGFASATLFDFTIGGGLMDFYVVNDTNRYEIMDLLVYIMFAPYGYFMVNFYEMLGIRKKLWVVLYILGWTIFGTGVQWVSEWMHMTTYQKGYRFEYNIVVFLTMQTVTICFYRYLKTAGRGGDSEGAECDALAHKASIS